MHLLHVTIHLGFSEGLEVTVLAFERLFQKIYLMNNSLMYIEMALMGRYVIASFTVERHLK